MAPRLGAYIRAYFVANRRLTPALLCALCLCAGALASVALGSPAGGPKLASSASSHSSKHPGKHARKRSCAKRSSFHAGGKPTHGGKTHHSKRHPRCRKHHGKGRHTVRHTAKHHVSTHNAPASHSSACQDADLRPSPDNLEAVRAATLCLVNRERTGNGESPLQPNGRLQQSAQGHSEDMAAGDYFEHDGPHGDTPLGRMRAAGYFLQLAHRLRSRREHRLGHAVAGLAEGDGRRLDGLAGPPREHPRRDHFHDTGIGISPHPLASLARGQAGAIYTQDFGVLFTP